LDAPRFYSVGISYLLHCIPGSIESKSVVLDHLKALMNPQGVLFGATLLQGGVTRNWFANRLMAAYNKRGIFSNERDDLEGLKRALTQRFRDVSVAVVGCAALFQVACEALTPNHPTVPCARPLPSRINPGRKPQSGW
jgi:hypothetical protein